MRRRLRNGAAAVVALAAAAACLPLAAAAVYPMSIEVPAVVLPPQTCLSLPVDFSWTNFDYQASIKLTGTLPDGCEPADVTVSLLYMGGTCTSLRNNEGSGCGGGAPGLVIPGDTTEADATYCEAVFGGGPPSALVQMQVPTDGFELLDEGSLCTQTSSGVFFVQNLCNATSADVLTAHLQVHYQKYSGGCGGGVSDWARITIGVICGLVAVGLLALVLQRCFRRPAPPQPAGGVQMAGAPVGGPPVQHGGYYTGSAAYVPPPSGAGYSGAWGAAGPAGYPPPSGPPPPTSYGYGAYGTAGGAWGGGYSQQPPAPPRPQHVPPPMATVVLGAPPEAGGSAGNGGGRPGGGSSGAAGSGVGGASGDAGTKV